MVSHHSIILNSDSLNTLLSQTHTFTMALLSSALIAQPALIQSSALIAQPALIQSSALIAQPALISSSACLAQPALLSSGLIGSSLLL